MTRPAQLGAADAARRLLAVRDRHGSAFLWVRADPGAGGGLRLLGEPGADGALAVAGTLGDGASDRAAVELGRRALAGDPDAPTGLHALPGGEAYLEVQRPAPELVIVGAGHVARPLAAVGALLGMDVTVLDDRPEFATRERFPHAARLLRVDFGDPFAGVRVHAGSHVVLVTRGHRYDFEALRRLLAVEPEPAYLGMIGSRRRVRATFVKLIEEGVDAARVARVRAPLGLDIRAQTPAEIAVAVAAEIVLLRRGGTGAPLRDVEEILERFFPDRAGSSTPARSDEP
jgi:xanthine dehydrogenase accessory factor